MKVNFTLSQEKDLCQVKTLTALNHPEPCEIQGSLEIQGFHAPYVVHDWCESLRGSHR
jgi:hypothetical protein